MQSAKLLIRSETAAYVLDRSYAGKFGVRMLGKVNARPGEVHGYVDDRSDYYVAARFTKEKNISTPGPRLKLCRGQQRDPGVADRGASAAVR
jgi:hypothetical protein